MSRELSVNLSVQQVLGLWVQGAALQHFTGTWNCACARERKPSQHNHPNGWQLRGGDNEENCCYPPPPLQPIRLSSCGGVPLEGGGGQHPLDAAHSFRLMSGM